jgi:hypothetical protein
VALWVCFIDTLPASEGAPNSSDVASVQSPPGDGDQEKTKEIGIPVVVYSHCGVRSVWVKGQLWLASPPLGGHNPPPGWDENRTQGVFQVTAPGRGLFKGDGGQLACFRLAQAGQQDPNAGCE